MTKQLLLLLVAGIFSVNLALQAQCTPGDSISCPDPENNGQICPETFPDAYVGQLYSVTATILPPPSVSYGTATAPLNKIVLLNVENLPPGLTWVSNSTTNTFFPGTYYCVLLSGTPQNVGTYPLKIRVGVYITFLGSPLYIGENVDSTSLVINVSPATDIAILPANERKLHISPNPFKEDARFVFYSQEAKNIKLDIFNLAGQKISSAQYPVERGENELPVDMKNLAPGLYIYRLASEESIISGKITRLQ